jgi:HEPN domain-containing protein
MPPDRFPPDDPREWLRSARSDLSLARADVPGADLEAFCFHAQQAAEKAIKGVLLAHDIHFPFVHDLGALLDLAARSGIAVSDSVRAADYLTDYAVLTRYPALEPVAPDEVDEAIGLAQAVVEWAEDQVAER